jgi:hypothetical protein
VEIDFRGTVTDVLKRLGPAAATKPADGREPTQEAPAPRGPGRPRLGVEAHEVTLLPRHWEWLNAQPGGASVTLRKLVEYAKRSDEGDDRIRRSREVANRFMSAMAGHRRSREAANRFMTAMAGNRPGFEEATRALFSGDRARFDALVESWPIDIRDYARRLASVSFSTDSAPSPSDAP